MKTNMKGIDIQNDVIDGKAQHMSSYYRDYANDTTILIEL